MLKNGFLKLLVQLDKLEAYWTNMLKEYPGHPVASLTRSAAPISIYGVLDGYMFPYMGIRHLFFGNVDQILHWSSFEASGCSKVAASPVGLPNF